MVHSPDGPAGTTCGDRMESGLSVQVGVLLLAVTITIPVTAWAVGRFGGRRLWLFGLILFLAGSFAYALAWNVGSLIAFRVVQGVGGGVPDPLVLVPLLAAVLLLGWYGRHALRVRRTPPLIDLRLFGHRSFAIAVGMAATLLLPGRPLRAVVGAGR